MCPLKSPVWFMRTEADTGEGRLVQVADPEALVAAPHDDRAVVAAAGIHVDLGLDAHPVPG